MQRIQSKDSENNIEFCLTIRTAENREIHNTKISSDKEDVRYFSSNEIFFNDNVSVLDVDVVVVVILNVYFDFHQNHMKLSKPNVA